MALPNLAKQAEDLTQLDRLYTIQNIMNAFVIKNILLTGRAGQADIVTFINPNLYQIAVKYYGDANFWTTIANANALNDPFYEGVINLLIPPKPSIPSTGVLRA